MRGATLAMTGYINAPKFQSTPPMRGATLTGNVKILDAIISIHAPHAGSDIGYVYFLHLVIISIHAPHAGSDC